MDKPEYCWVENDTQGTPSIFWPDGQVPEFVKKAGMIVGKFHIIYNKAGEIIRLERVETK